jgi:hypothetical protein
MTYSMLNTHQRDSAFYMPYSLSAHVLTIIASVRELWTSVLDFLEFNELQAI